MRERIGMLLIKVSLSILGSLAAVLIFVGIIYQFIKDLTTSGWFTALLTAAPLLCLCGVTLGGCLLVYGEEMEYRD